MEEIKYNKIYARTNENGEVIQIFSEAFIKPTQADFCINSTNIDRQGANEYQVYDENGFYNYTIANGKMVSRDKTTDISEKIKQERISTLKQWFDTEYRYLAEKYQRFIRLGIIDEDKTGTELLSELDLKAEEVRAEINILEK